MGASLPRWVLGSAEPGGVRRGAVLVLRWYPEPAGMRSPGIPPPITLPCPPACTLPAPLPAPPCFAVENPAHCEFPLLRDLLIR